MPIILFIIWLAFCSWLAGNILKRIFPAAGWIGFLLGGFLSIVVLGLVANIFTAWFKLTDLSVVLSFIIAALVLAAWFFVFKDMPEKLLGRPVDDAEAASLPPWVWLIFIISLAAGFYAVLGAADAGGLSSPWQVLPHWILLPVFICALIIFVAVFHGEKTWKTLGAIIVFSFLIHSYLLVYSNGFGADRFRHLASEERILSGLQYQPTLLADDLWLKRIGPIKIPAALVDGAKLSYGFQWSLEIIASKITGWPVFQINRFLLPILWSLFLPLLLYVISRLIWLDRRLALLAAGLGNSFYLLQYYGGQGLPASYGLLVFALAALLWLGWAEAKEKRTLLFCLFFSVLSYFNYSLAFIAVVVFGTLAESFQFKKITAVITAILAAVFLFFLDAGWPMRLSFAFDRLHSAWRDGNLLFFNSGSRLAAYVGDYHSAINYLAGAVFVGAVVWLGIKLWRNGNQRENLVALFFGVLISAYLACWLFAPGDHLLSRRLTLFAVLPLVFISAYGINTLLPKNKLRLAAAVFLAALTAGIYFSGPVLDVSLTQDDLSRARELWPGVKDNPTVCVREPLPVILALEYVSAKEFQETINNENCTK